MAAEQRVPTPDRSGERLGQLALAASPAGKLAPLRVLERHRGDAALAAAAPREAHQRDGGLPPLKLLPHPLLGEQLPPPGVKHARCAAGRRACRSASCTARPPAPCRSGRSGCRQPRAACEHSHGRAAVAAGLAAQPAPRPTGRARLLKPQLAVAHPAAASGSAGELRPSRRSPRSTCLPAWLPASYALRATDGR